MKKRIINMTLYFTLALLIPLFIPATNLFLYSQTEQCAGKLVQADSEYVNGHFAEAVALIKPCLKSNELTEIEKGKAFRLLGLVYIAEELEKEANEAVKNLLIMVPNYKSDPENDPPPLRKIIDEMTLTLIPRIDSITPGSIDQGKDGFTITVKGSNFLYGSDVRFNGKSKSTTFVTSAELKAEIPASDILKGGNYEVIVNNPIMGGKTSNSVMFKVQSSSSFPWTWIAVGGGVVAAGVVAILTLGGKEQPPSPSPIADPPGRP